MLQLVSSREGEERMELGGECEGLSTEREGSLGFAGLEILLTLSHQSLHLQTAGLLLHVSHLRIEIIVIKLSLPDCTVFNQFEG